MADKYEEELKQVKDRLQVLQASPASGKEQADWCHQDEIIGLLTKVTESLHATVTARAVETNRVFERLSSIEMDMRRVREDIVSLCKVVRDGNGQPSMVQRLANLEITVANNMADIKEVKGHANSIIAAKALSKSQVVAGLIGMIVTALLSTSALVATLMK